MHVVLFDMDGTLTEPRCKMNSDMSRALCDLASLKNLKLGILTGSDIDYVLDQCDRFLSSIKCNLENVILMPCNGTKMYVFENSKMIKVHDCCMIDHVSREEYYKIISSVSNLQSEILKELEGKIHVTGTFIQYRNSMINWCPIGRSSGKDERDTWKKVDINSSLRKSWLLRLKKNLKNKGLKNITIKLGGSTSFDIYPKGWNKTYALNHFPESKAFFTGDACEKDGNDFEIYEKIKRENPDRAFKTSSPEETLRIIKRIKSIVVNE